MQRILIVDNEPLGRRRLQARLEQDGNDVTVVSSGAEALEHVAAGPPTLVVLGVDLPDMDGFEVARRIRASREACHTTLILVHPHAPDDEDVLRGFSFSADSQLSKPLDLDLLVRFIRRISAAPVTAGDTPV